MPKDILKKINNKMWHQINKSISVILLHKVKRLLKTNLNRRAIHTIRNKPKPQRTLISNTKRNKVNPRTARMLTPMIRYKESCKLKILGVLRHKLFKIEIIIIKKKAH